MHLVRVPGAGFEDYQPRPELFRDFANLERTPEAVVNFANRYGALRQRLEFDSFPFWRTGIEQMAHLVALIDAVAKGDRPALSRALEPFLADTAIATADDLRPIRQKRQRGEEVSRNEEAHAAVMRVYHAVAPAGRLEGEASWNPLTGHLDLRLKSADLAGFMYLQLGRAFLGGWEFRQCLVCGKSLHLAPGVNRKDRKTCSDYCRLKLWRRQRAKAE